MLMCHCNFSELLASKFQDKSHVKSQPGLGNFSAISCTGNVPSFTLRILAHFLI